MIRLSPSSIALSQSDVEFHLQEVQIRGRLYAQGFTKEEVQRFYNDEHNSNAHGLDEDHVLSTQNPIAVWATPGEDPTQATKPMILAGGVRTPSRRSDPELDMHSSHQSLQGLLQSDQNHLAKMLEVHRNHHPPSQIVKHPHRYQCVLHRL